MRFARPPSMFVRDVMRFALPTHITGRHTGTPLTLALPIPTTRKEIAIMKAERDRIAAVLADCSYPGYRFVLSELASRNSGRPDRYVIGARFTAPDSCGPVREWSSRDWLLPPFVSDEIIVRAALACVLGTIEHEARERFMYRGAFVTNPHRETLTR